MKNIKKRFFLLLLLPLMAFTAHKFYVSVTNIVYAEKDDALQITTRIFIDDFENLLKQRYDIDAALATENEAALADSFIEKYLKTKFVVQINGQTKAFAFLGKEYDNDIMVCYLEIKNIDFPNVRTISVENEVLNDLFDDQKNIVHLKLKDERKSFVLIKGNNKGMLKL